MTVQYRLEATRQSGVAPELNAFAIAATSSDEAVLGRWKFIGVNGNEAAWYLSDPFTGNMYSLDHIVCFANVPDEIANYGSRKAEKVEVEDEL